VVILWDLTGEEPSELGRLAHADNVWDVAFSPNGQMLATAAADGSIRLWAISGRPRDEPLFQFEGLASAVAFGPEGRWLAAGNDEGALLLWDLADDKSISRPAIEHEGLVRDLAFSPDGRWLASASHDQTIILWDVAAAEPLGQPLAAHDDWVTGVDVSPDGRQLASSSRDGQLRSWSLDAWRRSAGEEAPILVHTFSGLGGPLWTVAFGPVKGALASAGSSGVAALWDLTAPTPRIDATLALDIDESVVPTTDRSFPDIAFSPDGSTLAVAVSGEQIKPDTDGIVFLVDVANEAEPKVILRQPGERIGVIDFSSDGRRLLSGGRFGSLQLWDVDPNSSTFGRPLGDPLVVRIVNLVAVAAHPHERLAASISENGLLTVWDLSTREIMSQLSDDIAPAPLGAEQSIDFAPDGSLLATFSDSGDVLLWRFEQGESTLLPTQDSLGQGGLLAFERRSGLLIINDVNNRVQLWDPAAGQPVGPVFDLQTDLVIRLALGRDGRLLAILGLNYELAFWDPWSGQPIGRPAAGPQQRAGAMAVSPDGRQLAVVYSPKGIITLWDFDPASWQDKACRRANRNLTQEEWEGLFGQEPYRPTCPTLPVPTVGS